MPRYTSIWFPYLLTEYVARKQHELRDVAFVLASPQRGRMVVEAASAAAMRKGIKQGMVVADCKVIFPELQVQPAEHGKAETLLRAIAEWSIRFTPFVAIDLQDGLIMDSSGCPHLWGGEAAYMESIVAKLGAYGYTAKVAIADTIGAAWAVARFGNTPTMVPPKGQHEALCQLPPAALRLPPDVRARLKKLGFNRIKSFIDMPPAVLRRRFGPSLPGRLRQALGQEIETIIPVKAVVPYQERLCSMEPISSAGGISVALTKLLEALCSRFSADGIGLRNAAFRAYRTDGNIQQLEIGTVYPSRNTAHLFRLFEHKIATLEPALGFETFVLEASKVEPVTEEQAAMWNAASQNNHKVAELLDRITAKAGAGRISRFLPAAHYWPERSIRVAAPFWEKPSDPWPTDRLRPVYLLVQPEVIDVTAVLPDYPPMLFRYKGKICQVVKSDGPERIEQEWWLSDGLYRDYYCVEDKSGSRYWVFRSGPYDAGRPKWYIHGFFA